jgi:hypothetical protein
MHLYPLYASLKMTKRNKRNKRTSSGARNFLNSSLEAIKVLFSRCYGLQMPLFRGAFRRMG